MDNSDLWKIVLVIIMMVFSALFSSTETAYSSVNKLRLKNYEAQGNKKASKALRLANKFDEVLTAVLIGNNIVNIATSSVTARSQRKILKSLQCFLRHRFPCWLLSLNRLYGFSIKFRHFFRRARKHQALRRTN